MASVFISTVRITAGPPAAMAYFEIHIQLQLENVLFSRGKIALAFFYSGSNSAAEITSALNVIF